MFIYLFNFPLISNLYTSLIYKLNIFKNTKFLFKFLEKLSHPFKYLNQHLI